MAAHSQTSLGRGLQVLTAVLDREHARADELAAALELPVSTVYRYLRDLRAAGLVAESGGGFGLGPRLAEQRLAMPSRTALRRLARPTLERLTAESGETSLLTVRSTTHALCLDQVESPQPMRMAFRVGQVLPLYAGAASRVLLAYTPSETLEQVLGDLERLTEATPSAEELPRRLRATRGSGVATSRGELVEGAVAIAVPVLNGDLCVCSVAVAAPERRASAGWQRRTKALLQGARRDLELLI